MVFVLIAALLFGDAEPHYYRGVALYADIVQGRASTLDEKRRTLDAALAAFDCAIALDAEHYPSIVYRGLTLRQHAFFETDAKKKQALLVAANAARDRVIEMVKRGKARKVEPDPMHLR